MFNDYVDERILAQTVVDESLRLRMRATLDAVRHNIGGGTRMYSALQHALTSVEYANENIETWVVCLTDGCSGDSHELVRPHLERSRENVHLIIVGVNLCFEYEALMQ
jgi:hypothetical protein